MHYEYTRGICTQAKPEGSRSLSRRTRCSRLSEPVSGRAAVFFVRQTLRQSTVLSGRPPPPRVADPLSTVCANGGAANWLAAVTTSVVTCVAVCGDLWPSPVSVPVVLAPCDILLTALCRAMKPQVLRTGFCFFEHQG